MADLPPHLITSKPLKNNDGLNSMKSVFLSKWVGNLFIIGKQRTYVIHQRQNKHRKFESEPWAVGQIFFSPTEGIVCLHHSLRWQWSPAHLLFSVCHWHFILGVYWKQRPVNICHSNRGEKGCRLQWVHTVSFTFLLCRKTIRPRLQKVTRMIAAVELNQTPVRYNLWKELYACWECLVEQRI